jgi:hypothetical protein
MRGVSSEARAGRAGPKRKRRMSTLHRVLKTGCCHAGAHSDCATEDMRNRCGSSHRLRRTADAPRTPPPLTRVVHLEYRIRIQGSVLYRLAIRVALVEEEAQVDDPAEEDAVEEEHAKLGRAVGDVEEGGRDEDGPVLDQDAWLGLGRVGARVSGRGYQGSG